MRIAFVTPEYVSEEYFDGGLANYLYRVCQALREQGHDVEVFTASNNQEMIVHDGIVVHRVNITRGRVLKFVDKITRHRFTKSLNILALSYKLRKVLIKRHNELPFSVIQASSYQSAGLLFTFKRPAPIVTRVSSYEPLWRSNYGLNSSFDQRLKERLEILSLRRSNAVYAPSELLSRILDEKEGVNVDTIRPPFSLETRALNENVYTKYLLSKKYFLFFGSIGLLKGGESIGESVPILLSKYPDLFFVMAGKVFHGPEKKRSMLDYILEKSGRHKDRIIYLGVLSHQELYPVIKHATAVVLPSLVDNLPNTLLEAMALGQVVIGNMGTSFEEVIQNGTSGILVEPGNSKCLCDAMETVYGMSEEERRHIGRNARQSVASLNYAEASNALIEYFEQVILKSRKPSKRLQIS